MKTIIVYTIYTALVTTALFLSGVEKGNILAMGSKGDVVQSQNITQDKKHSTKEHEGETTGAGFSPERSGPGKKEKALPDKKPRIKYRDESKCSC